MPKLLVAIFMVFNLSALAFATEAKPKFAECLVTKCQLIYQSWRDGEPVLAVRILGIRDLRYPAYANYVQGFQVSPSTLLEKITAINEALVSSCVRGVMQTEDEFEWERIPYCKPFGL